MKILQMLSSQEPTTTRAKRFRREPTKISAIGRWTERDYAILEALARFRFLTSTQLVELTGGSKQKINIRLRSMFHHGFVDRPPVQMDLWRKGSADYVYSVARKGIRKLLDSSYKPSEQLSLSVKDAPKRSAHIIHTLGISSFYMSLLRHAADRNVAIQWWPESKALRDRATILIDGKRRPFPIYPDAFFRLTVDGKGGLRACLEVDMGTEPAERGIAGGELAGADVAKKLRAYWQWGYVQKQHRNHPLYSEHAPKGFVVLLAVNSEQRLKQILSLKDKHAHNGKLRAYPLPKSDMFWVAVYDPHSKESIYDLDWQTFKGTTKQLV